jgi:chromosome segregation ATPase
MQQRAPLKISHLPPNLPTMDIIFDCPSCKGSLVADATCAGISLSCPHCSKWIQVPYPDGRIPDEHAASAGRLTKALDGVLEKELNDTRMKLRKAKSDAAELEGKLRIAENALKARGEDIANRLAESSSLLDGMKNEFNAITEERDRLKKEKADTDAQIADANKALEAARRDLETARRELEAARNESGESQKKYKNVIGALEQEKGRLDQEQKAVAAECEKLRGELTQRQAEVEQHARTIAGLNQEKASAEKAGGETTSRIKALEHERDKAAEALVIAGQAVEQSRGEARQILERSALLEKDLAQVKKDLAAATEQLTALKTEKQALEQKLAQVTRDADGSKGTLEKEIAEKARVFQAEREKLLREKNQAETSVARLSGQVDALKLTNDELRQTVEKLRAQNESIDRALQTRGMENEQLETALSDLQAVVAQVHKQLSGRRPE